MGRRLSLCGVSGSFIDIQYVENDLVHVAIVVATVTQLHKTSGEHLEVYVVVLPLIQVLIPAATCRYLFRRRCVVFDDLGATHHRVREDPKITKLRSRVANEILTFVHG